MIKSTLTLFTLLIGLNAQAQSADDVTEKLNSAITEAEVLTNLFINQITTNIKKTPHNEKVIFPYAPTHSEVLSLADEYHLLMLSLIQDFSVEDLTSRNYLEKLKENGAVKDFQSALYDQIIILKEDFQQDTKKSLEGLAKE